MNQHPSTIATGANAGTSYRRDPTTTHWQLVCALSFAIASFWIRPAVAHPQPPVSLPTEAKFTDLQAAMNAARFARTFSEGWNAPLVNRVDEFFDFGDAEFDLRYRGVNETQRAELDLQFERVRARNRGSAWLLRDLPVHCAVHEYQVVVKSTYLIQLPLRCAMDSDRFAAKTDCRRLANGVIRGCSPRTSGLCSPATLRKSWQPGT